MTRLHPANYAFSLTYCNFRKIVDNADHAPGQPGQRNRRVTILFQTWYSVETSRVSRYIITMAGISFPKTTVPGSEPALTVSKRAAAIARARAQAEAGETVPGEAVFEWLASWGTDKELPAPKPSRRRS
jgi:hypothetical protein